MKEIKGNIWDYLKVAGHFLGGIACLILAWAIVSELGGILVPTMFAVAGLFLLIAGVCEGCIRRRLSNERNRR